MTKRSLGFAVSENATRVAFGLGEPSRRFRGIFSLPQRSVALSPSWGELPGLQAPRMEAPGIALEGHGTPKTLLRMDGKDVLLPLSFCRVVTEDARAVWVAGVALHRISRDGRAREVARWLPVQPSAIAITRDERLVVVIGDDGTVRWLRGDNGKELLAFFPHPDGRRWVCWTPSGYYDCTVGAEEFLGWSVDCGPERAADFFPASRFRETYFRPEVIQRVLTTLDEGEALRQANAAAGRTQPAQAALTATLPPVATLLSPADGAEFAGKTLTLRYSVRTSADAPVTGIKVLVDGRPASTMRGVAVRPAAGAAGGDLHVVLPPHDCELSLLAENRHAASVPTTIRLKWKGADPSAELLKPRLYVLAVGISAYHNPEMRLRYAAKDAQDFVGAISRQRGSLTRDVLVQLLTDERATRDAIADGLEWLLKQTTSRDVAMLSVSGHGMNDERGNYYFVAANFDPKGVVRTGLPWSDIRRTVEGISGKVCFFVDSCHSGNAMGGRKGAALDLTKIINDLTSAENGAVVFAASTGQQVALEDPAWENGAFTKALVEGLGGKADLLKKGKITVNTLDAWVCERVKELTDGRQTPTTTKPQTVPDFPVAVVGG